MARRKFPWISANIYDTATHQPAYQPYLIKVVNGIRIGILGLTTPGIPYWDARRITAASNSAIR